jgi:hypothetical protein
VEGWCPALIARPAIRSMIRPADGFPTTGIVEEGAAPLGPTVGPQSKGLSRVRICVHKSGDSIEASLTYEPLVVTRHRRPVAAVGQVAELAITWQLVVGEFRVFTTSTRRRLW